MIFIPNFVMNHAMPDLEALSAVPCPDEVPDVYKAVLDYYFELAERAYQDISKEDWRMAKSIPNPWLRARWLTSLFFFGAHFEDVQVLDLLITQQIEFVETHDKNKISQFYVFCMPYGHMNMNTALDTHNALRECLRQIVDASKDTRYQFNLLHMDTADLEIVEIIQLIIQDELIDQTYLALSNKIYEIWNRLSDSPYRANANRKLADVPTTPLNDTTH